MIGFKAGHFLNYDLGPWFCLSFPVLFFVLYSFMHETPYYLMKNNRVEVCSLHSISFCIIFCEKPLSHFT